MLKRFSAEPVGYQGVVFNSVWTPYWSGFMPSDPMVCSAQPLPCGRMGNLIWNIAMATIIPIFPKGTSTFFPYTITLKWMSPHHCVPLHDNAFTVSSCSGPSLYTAVLLITSCWLTCCVCVTFLSEQAWQGVCGAPPDPDQLQEVVATKDLYMWVNRHHTAL